MPTTSGGQLAEGAREERLREVFNTLDANQNGKLEVPEIQAALRELGLPAGSNYVRELLQQYDQDGDREVTFEEFRRYVATKEAAIHRAFVRVDADRSGQLDAEEVLQAVEALGLAVTPAEVARMVSLLDRDGDSRISYEEFRRFVVLLPGAQVSGGNILSAWLDSADWVESMEYRLNHIPPRQPLERFMAGGVAGAVSRTVVAPLERLRTIMMADAQATRLGPVLRGMWADGGVRGLFRGNMATVVKVFPASAIQFACYDGVKDIMLHRAADKTADLSHGQKFTAGLVAGAAATSATYPLEALRTQIQVAKGAGSSYATILRGLLAERGVAGLYQGFSAGFANNALTQALGFATYEGLCSGYKGWLNQGEPPSTSARGMLGGVAALIVMTLTMPLENVMRRLQVQGRPGFPRQYSGALDCTAQMLRREGVGSFWRGSVSSWLKVVPSIAATRLLFEGIVAWRGIGGVRRYRLASERGAD